jgi:hypothetical protein
MPKDENCSSISQMARDSLEQEGIHLQDRLPRRKRVFDHDDTLMRLIIKDRKQHIVLQDMDVTVQHTADMLKVVDLQDRLTTSYINLCKNGVMDEAARSVFRENILRIADQSVVNGWNAVKKRSTSTENE